MTFLSILQTSVESVSQSVLVLAERRGKFSAALPGSVTPDCLLSVRTSCISSAQLCDCIIVTTHSYQYLSPPIRLQSIFCFVPNPGPFLSPFFWEFFSQPGPGLYKYRLLNVSLPKAGVPVKVNDDLSNLCCELLSSDLTSPAKESFPSLFPKY